MLRPLARPHATAAHARRAVFASLLAFGALWLALASTSRAEAPDDGDARAAPGLAQDGLCGLYLAQQPRCSTYRLTAAASAGYGYFESLGPVAGAHQRLGGKLGLGVVPLPWLAVSLGFEGHYDRHPPDSHGPDRTLVGSPQLALRAGRPLTERWTVGTSAAVSVPGSHAPSLTWSATSVELRGLAAFMPRRTDPYAAWSLLGNLGFRLDRSARGAPDPRRLRPGDRIALGMSDSNALLVALGVSRALPRGQWFVEFSGDLLLGARAPALAASPLRAALGGRFFARPRLQLELLLSASLSRRPNLAVSAPFVPVEPRFGVSIGVRYGLPRAQHASSPRPAVEAPGAAREPHLPRVPTDPPAPSPVRAAPELPVAPASRGSVSGSVSDADGAPLPEVSITLEAGTERLVTVSDAAGRYEIDELAPGASALLLSAPGFEPTRMEVEVLPGRQELPAVHLVPAQTGLLRCLVRTFHSDALRAQIVVVTARGSAREQNSDTQGREVAKGESNEQGHFEIMLPPGTYQVIISSSGYRSHRRTITVSSNGVAILNVDMREQ